MFQSNTYRALLALAVAVLMTGCATPTAMPFSGANETVAMIDKPIYLMTTSIDNRYHTSFKPKLIVVNVEKGAGDSAQNRINFPMDDKAREESDTTGVTNNYYLRMALDEGNYVIRGMSALGRSFPLNGFFYVPMHSKLDVSKKGVFYLGHVQAIVRERVDNEFKAGPSFPLIDQAAAGASGGTFDVEISDQWETDKVQFLSRFPALKDADIQKAILPKFDRAFAQTWWEAH